MILNCKSEKKEYQMKENTTQSNTGNKNLDPSTNVLRVVVVDSQFHFINKS